MKINYFSIHKNKKPKKPKYSHPLSKQQKEGIIKCIELFFKMSNELRAKMNEDN